MKRESIILSDLDLSLMEYLKEEKTINQLLTKFDMGHSQSKKHIGRLQKISTITTRKYGPFKIIKLNKKGFKVLKEIENE